MHARQVTHTPANTDCVVEDRGVAGCPEGDVSMETGTRDMQWAGYVK